MTDAGGGGWTANAAAGGGTPGRTVTLTDLLRVPLHRIRVLAGTAALGLLAGLGYVLLVPSAVTADAVVAVRPVVTDAFTPSGASADRAVNMNVERGIATGTEVVRRLVDATGRDQRDVQDALELEVPTGGQILRFRFTANSSQDAVAGVNLAAAAYLDVRRTMYEQQRADILRSYDESISEVQEQQAALQRRIASAREGEADAAVAELSGVNSQLVQLGSARTEIAAVDVNPGWVTREAEPDLLPTGGNQLLHLLAGLLGGVLLGVVLAYGWESVDRRIRSVDDGRDATGLPLLGTARGPKPRGSRQAVDADIRYVAMAIAGRTREPTRIVLLTTRGDQTAMSAGLAVALAGTGREVYLADDTGRLERLRSEVLAGVARLPATANSARPPAPQQRQERRTAPVDEVTEQIAVRRPSPRPTPAPRPTAASRPTAAPRPTIPSQAAVHKTTGAGNGTAANRPASDDPDGTILLPRIASTTSSNGKSAVGAPADTVAVGGGTIRFGTWGQRATSGLVLFNAPPAEADERGVAAARQGVAVVVVEQDQTRQGDLRRLAERLRAAGVVPLGFVLTHRGRG
ncbi:lipopolysaccharide biosynthesis protein [Salinispora sp. H7-4]|uniref:lipopolysaccharide biosynthesis protein n=1 Tax=Salinispora sp. H7-4 TaxID=2748321 RepID=UPI0015D2283B|nr:lipopolysaccharide biosynthesis protein [Salinispora sp. H7-4]NYT95067.1 lipopolysaccharide biosynthesis protein [Salinispora sp. H7-4]